MLIVVAGAALFGPSLAVRPHEASNFIVVGNSALAAIPASAGIVHRLGVSVPGDAPELPYVSQQGSCKAHGFAMDGGACVDAADGNSWRAVFPSGRIDIRQFGAKADDTTPADEAIASAKAYAGSIGACVYVPSIYPGFRVNSSITLNSANGSDCLIGDRGIKLYPPAGAFGKFVDLTFPNDTDGIVIAGNNGWYVGGVAIKGHAAESTTAVRTHGITVDAYDGKIENLFIQDFVVCKLARAPSNKFVIRDVSCDEQRSYPNILNDYPLSCTEMLGSNGATAAFQETGGECRAQAGGNDAEYVSDGSTSWFEICPPGVISSKPETGHQLDCSGAPNYQVPLWRTDGVKVRIGNPSRTRNGQPVLDAPLSVCGLDYTIWDVSVSGGGGAGGIQLYCNRITAVLSSGNTGVAVPSTVGIPAGANILVTADHGLSLATKLQHVIDGTHLALSKAPYINGAVTINTIQIAIATSGPPDYSQACQTVPGQGSNSGSCGYKIEVRLTHAPPAGTPVDLQWNDPTGYAAYLAETVSDYVFLRPTLVGGWDIGLKHVGLSDGGIEFRPTYIELLNQCIAIEHRDIGGGAVAPYGDVIDLHRIINDPIPDCPGYVDAAAGPTIVSYNNFVRYYNGAGDRSYPKFQ